MSEAQKVLRFLTIKKRLNANDLDVYIGDDAFVVTDISDKDNHRLLNRCRSIDELQGFVNGVLYES